MTPGLLYTSVVIDWHDPIVVAAVAREGRKPSSRLADLLIAATAHAHDLDLYTRNGEDFAGLEDLVHVVVI